MATKICTSCNKDKELTEYYRDRSIVNSIGYRSKCKDCVKVMSKNRKKYDKKDDITDKTCNVCNTKKTIENFYKSTRHLDGYFAHCKKCHNIKLENVGSNPKIKRTPEVMREYWKKRLNDINYHMKQNIRRSISSSISNIGDNKKFNRTTKYIGCSIEFFKKWIEFRFDNNMTLDNYGTWELDHVKPCASFNMSKEEEIMDCFNWKNYQPLQKEENRRKSNNIIEKYFVKQKEAIETFLTLYNNELECNNNYYKLNVRLPEVKTLTD